jgi:hypothetical protein
LQGMEWNPDFSRTSPKDGIRQAQLHVWHSQIRHIRRKNG